MADYEPHWRYKGPPPGPLFKAGLIVFVLGGLFAVAATVFESVLPLFRG